MNFSAETIEKIYEFFNISHHSGLGQLEVTKNTEKYGKNILPEKKKNRIKMFFSQFIDPLVIILLIAIGISLAIPYMENGSISFHESIEAMAIFIILIINAIIGFWQEIKAEKNISALKKMQSEYATVLRNAEKKQIKTEDLVPGDLVFLAEGDKIPADIRLTKTVSARTQESALTGESALIEKNAQWTGDVSSLGDMQNMVFSGTELISGRAEGIVVKTGVKTEVGKIAQMISHTTSPKTPLEIRLEKLGKIITVGVIVTCAIILLIAYQKNIPFLEALLTAVSLAVGAVPEGLPAVMTITLAIGVSVMARKKSLVRELKSVETLGSISVIASDKTGTITQNKMRVEEIFWNGNFLDKNHFSMLYEPELFEVMKNCNDAKLPNIGDPTEIALLETAEQFNAAIHDRIDEIPFSSEKKWMSTTHQIGNEQKEFIKGAPEVVYKFCHPDLHQSILQSANTMAEKGLRTLAILSKTKGESSAKFLGIIGLQDPPRESVKGAINLAKQAGIKTIMITGDHAVTAKAIGKQVGIISEVITGPILEKTTDEELREMVKEISIFARVSPEHKVRICKALQENGEVVAMTGDGVNDAPALSQAQVGVSMGKVGTAVARGASQIVLMDDDYGSIVRGIQEGRRIFENIKKSIAFLLSTNFSEVIIILGALLLSLPLPLLAIHILLLNLLTDSFPALSLAFEKEEKDIMKQKPRPLSQGFLHGRISQILVLGGVQAIMVLFLFASVQGQISLLASQTLAFITLAFLELFLIFSLRNSQLLFSKGRPKNKWAGRSFWLGTLIIAIGLLTPLAYFFHFELFPLIHWTEIFLCVVLIVLLAEAGKKFGFHPKKLLSFLWKE